MSVGQRRRVFNRDRVREARAALQLSRARLGRLVGRSAMCVYLWETGRTVPKGESVAALADALGQTTDYFYDA